MKKLFIIVAAISCLDSAIAVVFDEENTHLRPIDTAGTEMHPLLLALEPLEPNPNEISQRIEEEDRSNKTVDAIMLPSQPNYREIVQSVHEINDRFNEITIYLHRASEGMERRYILDGGFLQSRKPKLSTFERIMLFFSCC
jgi:hypothetical protein